MLMSKYNDYDYQKGKNTGGALVVTKWLVGQAEGLVGKFPQHSV